MVIKKELKLSAQSVTEKGEVIAVFSGGVNTENPENISYSPVITNQMLYKENRDKVNQERNEFENAPYAEQEKMMNLMKGTE